MNIDEALAATPPAPATQPRRQEHPTGREFGLSGSVVERFLAKVDRSGDCWLWIAGTAADGYGTFWLNGAHEQAHRVAYSVFVGDIPSSIVVDHMCRVRNCVNPEHLRLATRKQNNEHRSTNGHGRSGVRGVSWHAQGQCWKVRVGHNGRQHWGGLFDDVTEAEEAARALRNRLHTHNLLDRDAS